MQERDVLDLLGVVVLAVLTYVETFGLADPLATVAEVLSILLGLDGRTYLILAGAFGVLFLTYLTMYLPRKDAERSVR